MPRRLAPDALLRRFQEELERLFSEALELAAPTPGPGRWQPALDILENDDAVLLVLEVPGVAAESLEVEVEGGEIVVRGARPAPAPAARSRFLRLEREHGRFERRIKLFWPVNSHRGSARLRNGLLILELPKIQERRQRRRSLPVEVENPGASPEGAGGVEPQDLGEGPVRRDSSAENPTHPRRGGHRARRGPKNPGGRQP